MTPDINVLVAAARSDHPHHAVVRAWLEHAATGAAAGSTLVLMPMVVASFLRLVTSAKIFTAPTRDRDFRKLVGRSQFTLLEPGGWVARACVEGPFATPLSSFVRAHPLKGESAKLTL